MINIEKLLYDNVLSVRSFNACQANGLLTADAVVQYFLTHKTFLDLPNLGSKSNEELIAFCKTQKLYKEKVRSKKINVLQQLISFPEDKNKLLELFIHERIHALAKRASDIVSENWQSSISLADFYIKFLFEGAFEVTNNRNAGNKTLEQLQTFAEEAQRAVEDITAGKQPQVVSFSEVNNNSENSSIIDEQTFKLPFFKALESLISERSIFGSDSDVANELMKLYSYQEPSTLREIAEKIDVSRQRVLQKRERLFERLLQYFSVFKSLNTNCFSDFNIDSSQSFFFISDEIANKINAFFDLKFTTPLLSLAVHATVGYTHTLLGKHEYIISSTSSNSTKDYAFQHYYSVENKFNESFDIQSFANDLSNKLSDRVYDAYPVALSEYLEVFIKDIDVFHEYNGLDIIKTLITHEFELNVNEQNELIIPRNQRLTASQMAFRALEAIGHAAHLSDIHQKVRELFPGFDKDEESIRSALNRESGFVPIGRQSLFGLQKWENERDDFRGGTYRDIAIEYLDERNYLVHLVELYEYTLKYRPLLTIENLRGTLLLDSQDSFLFFNSNFIGLKVKEPIYDLPKYNNLPQQLTKKIVGKMQRGYDREACIRFLKQTYDLDRNESINILKYIELGQDD